MVINWSMTFIPLASQELTRCSEVFVAASEPCLLTVEFNIVILLQMSDTIRLSLQTNQNVMKVVVRGNDIIQSYD